MPFIDKRNRNNWYNSIPVSNPLKGNPLMDPDFSIEKMEGNEINLGGDSIIAKIPEIKGRIFRDKKGGSSTSIVLLTDRYPDPANPGKIRHERVVIGAELFGRFAGLMAANDKYHEYFDTKGKLVYDPLQRRKEREAREAAKEAQRKAEKTGAAGEQEESQEQRTAEQGKNQKTGHAEPKTDITEKERTVDEIRESLLRKEELVKQQLLELAQKKQQLEEAKEELVSLIEERRYEIQERDAAHLALLDIILDSYFTTVKEQAKRRPDALMRLTQVRTINEILKELQEWFAGTEAEDYLHLADEPREDDLEHHPGTTYGEMSILLSAYTHTIYACRFRKLYWKQGFPVTPEEEDET